jgi:MIP family channel proteins
MGTVFCALILWQGLQGMLIVKNCVNISQFLTQEIGAVCMDKKNSKFPLNQVLLAEAFGTFLLTFVDSVVAIVDHNSGGAIGDLGKSMAPAAVVGTMIFLIGEVSGAHINPVVTLSFASRKVFPWTRVPAYLAVQFLGAVLAGFLIYSLFGSMIQFGATEPKIGNLDALIFEILTTWFLVTAIVTSSCEASIKGWEAAFPVGLTLTFCNLIGKQISGASMNPARTFGVAIFADGLSQYWIYSTGPILGAVLGVLTAFTIRGEPTKKEVRAAQGK